MKNAYKKALLIPAFFETAFLVKKDTVKGIIGKTQGVNKATKPPRKPIKKRCQRPFDGATEELFCKAPQLLVGFSISIVGTSIFV